MTKEEEQKKLLREYDMVYVGNGPRATQNDYSSKGWRMASDLYAKCIKCNYYMSLSKEDDEDCFCRTLHKEYSWGRFGSKLGDLSIEIYKIRKK